MSPPPDAARPVFVFDGDCGICREWVDCWRELTAGRIDFRPYQEAAADYPQVPRAEFERAVQLIQPDGGVTGGAEATFALYRGTFPQSALPVLYRRLPGFARLSEFFYSFFSQRRGLLAVLTHLFWGRNFRPVSYGATTWLFLRLLGLIYLAAFLSFGIQAQALIGSDGVLPLARYLDVLDDRFGRMAWYLAPGVFWLHAGDAAIMTAWIAGCVLALLLAVNVFVRAALPLLFILYLSVYHAGQTFMAFQWDLLLLEAGFLAIFLPRGAPIVAWLYRWLAFRFMFLGGMVKLLSRDPTWDNLTALQYHFETQPLPTLAAWYAHQLPEWFLSASVAVTLIIEIVIPFLVFCPRRLRMFAGGCFIFLQSLIILTGNYNFFNLLTIAVCLFLFDDAALRRLLPGKLLDRRGRRAEPAASAYRQAALAALAGLVLFVSGESMLRLLGGDRSAQPSAVARAIRPCNCVNSYGPFAIMTRVRNEIVIEGTADGREWREYQFRYKPGDPARITGWIIPHQPRLDWQMWFAALSTADRQPWFQNLLARLLLGSAPVLKRFERNPFPGSPPAAVRALFYRYEFTTPAERRDTGHWWKRTLLGEYHPPMRINRISSSPDETSR
jgi:predicted DCC family thiol-disulfide oxidoreductase YuxK